MEAQNYHESSILHVTGRALFIDDIEAPTNTLTGYVVTSNIAHGRLTKYDLTEAKKSPGVFVILSAKDIPGKNQMGTIVNDEPVLVEETISFIGQALFLIAATSEAEARIAAEKIKTEVEIYKPIITLEQAIAEDNKLHPTVEMTRGNAAAQWAICPHILEGEVNSGAQEHWYLETQIALVVPGEYNEIKVFSSTQHPSETQALIAEVLHINKNDVVIETRRLGGAYGGKETQANMVAIWAALLAKHTGHSIKIKLFRDCDQIMTGKRHPFKSRYKIGFDSQGKIMAFHVKMFANAGYSSDLTQPVLARARTHAENAYYIPHIAIETTAYKTNLPSNTAFRGFGAPQGIFLIEQAIEHIAFYLKLDACKIRHLNYYQSEIENITPYGQIVENNRLSIIEHQILKKSDYQNRKKIVDEFNLTNSLKKRGIALTPVKFGISFNTPHLNQAGAFVNIYTDGTVQVNQGGIEMGQGLYTKIRKIAAQAFGIDTEKIKVNSTSTLTVPNTSATAASSGTDLNGMATLNACNVLKKRMVQYLKTQWSGTSSKSISFEKNKVFNIKNREQQIDFSELANALYLNSISLSAQGYYQTPNLSFDKATQKGKPFHYFVFGMAISEVELDLLTGQHQILQTDILHDAGKSLNPDIDKGQIEGAFIQSVGWCTTEEIKHDTLGNLLNHSPDTYKIPGIRNIPKRFNVHLLQNAPNNLAIKQSKAVGEPPFIYGLSVLFALQQAICAATGCNSFPNISIPATHEKIVLTLKTKIPQ